MAFFINPEGLPQDGYGKIQLIFLLLVYGFILSKSSAMISDGSELLLLIPALAGIVGSVVLPILGAVPDGAIVLFSGMGPDAQKQLNVGVGALAGSTIMLLTIPWALCIFAGRVNVDNGEADYHGKPKLTHERRFSIFGSGITPKPSIAKNGLIMIITAVAYIVIQGAAFGANCDLETEVGCKGGQEHWWALVALVLCLLSFAGYLWYNVRHANDEDQEAYVDEVRKQAIESHIISLSTAFERALKTIPSGVSTGLLTSEDEEKRFENTLKSFFNKYDRDGNGVIDPVEMKLLLIDVGENMSEERFLAFLRQIDTDNSGTISFKEFAVVMKRFLQNKRDNVGSPSADMSMVVIGKSGAGAGGQKSVHVEKRTHEGEEKKEDDEEEEEEEEEVPEDLASLPPSTQKMRILWRATWMMGLGTAIVLLFSDPMVDVLNELGVRFKVKPFYVAFVLAPLASNASELIASINYATKKTKKTITISLGALEGAACMNNTFCLAIFLCLIFFKNLTWEFSAETISIVFVELVLFGFAFFRKTHRIFEAFIILAMYPISLVLVYLIEDVGGLN